MKKGFSLIEIMVAILLVCVISAGAVRMLLASNSAGRESTQRTYASVMAKSMLISLQNSSAGNVDINPGWHTDSYNPLVQDNIEYSRYWSVSLNNDGSMVMNVYVAWTNNESSKTYSSEKELLKDSVYCVRYKGIRDGLMP